MSVSMTSPRTITRPSTTPVTSTILDHAPAKTVDRFGLMNNAGLWPSYNCIDTLIPTPMCPDPLLEAGGEPKVFTGHVWIPAFEFAVYAGVKCSLVAHEEADAKAEVKRVFEWNQAKGIERALAATRFIANPATSEGDPVFWDAPTDLTPSADVSLLTALALLEGDAADKYTGLPIIHMPRAAATILGAQSAIHWADGKAFTSNGSRVAIGGGYDDEAVLATGEWTMYATGEVYIEQSEQIDLHAYVVPGDGNGIGSGETGLADNEQIVLAERMFRVGIDCYLSQATGKVF